MSSGHPSPAHLLGVPGHPPFAAVDERGVVTTADGRLEWAIGAEDRWHHVTTEAAVRRSVEGDGAVVETRMRIPGGDAVARAWAAVVTGRPALVVEIENTSPVPVAVAVGGHEGGPAVTSRRAPSDASAAGDDAPPGSRVWPLPHRNTLRFAVAGPLGAVDPDRVDSLPDPAAVTAGWATHLHGLTRISVDGEGLADRWRNAARTLALVAEDPFGGVAPIRSGGDVAHVAVALGLLGLDERAMALLDRVLVRQRRDGRFDVVEPPGDRVALAWAAARVALCADGGADWFAEHALVAARALDRADAGEPRVGDARRTVLRALRLAGQDEAADHLASRIEAGGDLDAPVGGRDAGSDGPVGSAAHTVVAIAAATVADGEDGVELVVDRRLTAPGVTVEVIGLPTSHGRLSFATRWHGEHPALLWEIDAARPVPLRCRLAPGWTADELRGETLLVEGVPR